MRRTVAAIAAMTVLAGCGTSEPAPADSSSSSPAAARTSTRAAAPTTTSDLNFSDEADAEYLAALAEKGITLDEDDMVGAGQGVCLMMVREGEDLITSSAWVMDSFEVTGDQAGDIATTAIEVYCPSAR